MESRFRLSTNVYQACARNMECLMMEQRLPYSLSPRLTLKIRDFRNTEGLAMVQIRYRGGFETKSEAFT